MTKLYKAGPGPRQVQANPEQSCSGADLKGKAGAFAARLGRGACKSDARAQCCRKPAPAFTQRLLGCAWDRAAPAFPEPASLGRRRQAGARHSWSCRPPCSRCRRKQHQTSLGLSASQHPQQCWPSQHGAPPPPSLLGITVSAEREGAALLPNPGVTAAEEGWSQFLLLSQPQGAAPARGEHLLPADSWT